MNTSHPRFHYKHVKYERPGLTSDEIEEIKDAFALFDDKSEGYIQSKDMLRAMRSLGMESKHKKLVGNIDNHIISKTEGDGRMNFEEFLDIVSQNMHENMSKEDTNRVFEFIDRDRNGKISLRDLKATATELGEELSDNDLARMIEKADIDRDGEVGPDEFYTIVAKIAYT